MKHVTDFNTELSILMDKYKITKSILVSEIKEGDAIFIKTVLFDDDKNKSRKSKLLKEASKLFKMTGLDHHNFKMINDILEHDVLESDMLEAFRDLKEFNLSQDNKKKLESIRSNKKNAVKDEKWELAAKYRAEELEFLGC